jgi:hypothetical protein
MKTIINGKRYDTETAELLAERPEWDISILNNDGELVTGPRALYRTKRGTLFGLAGENIIPFDVEDMDRSFEVQAARWMERAGFNAEQIEALFPNAIEDA